MTREWKHLILDENSTLWWTRLDWTEWFHPWTPSMSQRRLYNQCFLLSADSFFFTIKYCIFVFKNICVINPLCLNGHEYEENSLTGLSTAAHLRAVWSRSCRQPTKEAVNYDTGQWPCPSLQADLDHSLKTWGSGTHTHTHTHQGKTTMAPHWAVEKRGIDGSIFFLAVFSQCCWSLNIL